MFDTTFVTPPLGRYLKHQWIDAVLKKPGVDQARDFIWSEDENDPRINHLRCADPRPGFNWQPTIIPAEGDLAEFFLRAAPRRGSRNRKFPIVARNDQLSWLERVFAMIGLRIVQADVRKDNVLIDDSPSFVIVGGTFRGEGIVANESALRQAMLHGVGNAKVYGFGLLQFNL